MSSYSAGNRRHRQLLIARRWEGSPLAVQEVLAAGRPLIATDAGGIASLVGAGAALVAPADAVALACAIDELLDDPRARDELAAAGRAQARTWPSPEQVVEQLIDVYDAVIR